MNKVEVSVSPSSSDKKENLERSDCAYYGHIDFVAKLKNAFDGNDLRKCVEITESFADAGDSIAADLYGDMLMCGVWDISRMKYDLVRDDLIPLPDDPRTDDYLILPRNPLLAIEFYKTAASDRINSDDFTVLERIQSKLEFCRRKGYAGMEKCQADYSISIDDQIANFLELNAKSAAPVDMESSIRFQSLPDFRPKIQDPRKEMFKNMASYLTRRSIIQLMVLTLFSVMFGDCIGLSLLSSLTIALSSFGWPLILFAATSFFYAKPRGIPLCCCANLKKAHLRVLEDLKLDSPNESAFENAPAFVKYAQQWKYLIFWAYSVFSFSVCIIGYDFINKHIVTLPFKNDSSKVDPVLGLIVLLPSISIMFWEKTFDLNDENNSLMWKIISSGEGYNSQSNAVFLGILLLLSFLLADSDCFKERLKPKKREGIEKLIEAITQK